MIAALICTAIFIASVLAVCTLPEANEPLFPWDETDE